MKYAAFLTALLACSLILAACGATPIPLPTTTPTLAPTTTATVIWFPATATATPAATQAVQPTAERKPGVGQLITSDNFSDQTRWSTSLNSQYSQNTLTLSVQQPRSLVFSLNKTLNLDDAYLEITSQASLCRGSDSYGLLLRATSGQDYYRWLINCAGQQRLERLKGGQAVLLQDWMPSGQLAPGSPITARLGVWAVRDELRFFINGVYQFSSRDPVWRAGTLGVFARSAGDTPVSVSFSQLEVYAVFAPPTATPTITPTPTRTPSRTPSSTATPRKK